MKTKLISAAVLSRAKWSQIMTPYTGGKVIVRPKNRAFKQPNAAARSLGSSPIWGTG